MVPVELSSKTSMFDILKSICRSLRNKIEGSHEAARRAASLPILQCHGNCMSLHNHYANMSLPIYLTANKSIFVALMTDDQ